MEVALCPFPCPLERTVASALLLLSASPPSLSPPSTKKSKSSDSECLFTFSSGNSKSCVSTSSTVTIDDGSSVEFRGGRLFRVIPRVDPFFEMTRMKVVRKSRSKTFWIGDCRKISSGKPATIQSSGTASEATDISSCLSTESSLVSSGQSTNLSVMKIDQKEETETTSFSSGVKRKTASSGSLSGRCEAIMKVLSNGSSISEVRIRQMLGDTPDTSKALRMLLKREEVRRSGAGGRTDPYIYKRAMV